MNKEIAIIIPVYNALDYIKILLQSISGQTMKELCKIILIIDDNNNYKFIQQNFPDLEIVFLHTNKAKSGPGIARNIGLKYIIQQNIPYIVFADADDIFFSTMAIEILYTTMIQSQTDYVVAEFYKRDHSGLCKYEDFDVWLFSKLYKTEIIKEHNISFPSAFVCEDLGFNLHYTNAIKNFQKVPYILYVWQQNMNSLTNTDPAKYSYLSLKVLCETYEKVFNQINEQQKIPVKQIKKTILRKTVCLYFDYNNYRLIADPRYVITDVNKALNNLYHSCFKKYWHLISQDDWMEEWNYFNGLGTIMPQIGFFEFLKIMTKERSE